MLARAEYLRVYLRLALPYSPGTTSCLCFQGGYASRAVGNGALNSYGGNAPQTGGSLQDGDLLVADYRAKHDMNVFGEGVPDPFQSFRSVGFPPDIMDEVLSKQLRRCALCGGQSVPSWLAAVAIGGLKLWLAGLSCHGAESLYRLQGCYWPESVQPRPQLQPLIAMPCF